MSFFTAFESRLAVRLFLVRIHLRVSSRLVRTDGAQSAHGARAATSRGSAPRSSAPAPGDGLAGAPDRARRRAVALVPARFLLPARDQPAVELELRDPHRRVAARQRRRGARREGGVHLLRAHRAEQGRPDAARAAAGGRRRRGHGRAAVAPAANTAPRACTRCCTPRCPARACGTPHAPAWKRTRRCSLTTLRNQPEYPRVVAGLAWIDTKRTTRRAARRAPGAIGVAAARDDGRTRGRTATTAGDLQQRLQARRLPRRVRAARPHLRAHARRAGHARRLQRRHRRRRRLDATVRTRPPACPSPARTCR